jgi:hypothetical protein
MYDAAAIQINNNSNNGSSQNQYQNNGNSLKQDFQQTRSKQLYLFFIALGLLNDPLNTNNQRPRINQSAICCLINPVFPKLSNNVDGI